MLLRRNNASNNVTNAYSWHTLTMRIARPFARAQGGNG